MNSDDFSRGIPAGYFVRDAEPDGKYKCQCCGCRTDELSSVLNADGVHCAYACPSCYRTAAEEGRG